MSEVADTRRLNSKPQDLMDAYGPPSNFLEIDVYDPQINGIGRNRYTTYQVRMRVGIRTICQNTLLQHLKLTSDRCVFANQLACLAALLKSSEHSTGVVTLPSGAWSSSRWRVSKNQGPGIVSGLSWRFVSGCSM